MELEEQLRKVSFHSKCSSSTLFLLFILIRLFCQAQQSQLSSPWAAEVLPCLLLAWRFSRPLPGQHPAGSSSCAPSCVLCRLLQRRGSAEGQAQASSASEELGRINHLCVMLRGWSAPQGSWLSVPLLSSLRKNSLFKRTK